MTTRDWDFAMGSLGDPLADIKDWMIPPYPTWMPAWQRRGELHGTQKEDDMGDEDTYTEGYRDGQRDLAQDLETLQSDDMTNEEILTEINIIIDGVIHGTR